MWRLSQIILIVQRALNKNDGCSAIIFSLVITEMAFEIINNEKVGQLLYIILWKYFFCYFQTIS